MLCAVCVMTQSLKVFCGLFVDMLLDADMTKYLFVSENTLCDISSGSIEGAWEF